VRSVLPARVEGGATDSLLVATTSALAIVTGDPGSRSARWMTRWAPWDVVHLEDDADALGAPVPERYDLAVVVDRLRFHSHLQGEAGLRAMRDFIAASRERRSSLLANR
jgi:hypothetical protein